jgi:hypothetical protein
VFDPCFIRGFNGFAPIRQAEELAEGQKSASVKHFFIRHPPSARQRQLAEWLEFPEKNAGLVICERHLAGRGRPPKLHPLIKLDSFWTVDSIPEVLW